ncbi:LOW QUALITY PROTEIN: uncharacterized protein LOC115021058 [Cottoperca gobio]|uniref:LOW QUALITY PROTEIN: uncharacterized protein LOC115021058 n=1 Tax=Cottoperca gobio TaxID=56716 RepID=A0A6J2RC88_COTGO|nr:LOW QUALITY PROTEIN: uncharacterized protein LOC115021058 [Cottoperca gobio]
MKMPGLIDLTLILFLASSSKGTNWSIDVPRSITAGSGSNVTIRCNFTYPNKSGTEYVQVYWKKPESSPMKTDDNELNAFVFHPNDIFVLEKYRGRTKLTGNISNGDCSLKIFNFMDNEPMIYVRVVKNRDKYSFRNNFVSISLSGPGVKTVTFNPDMTQQSITFEAITMGTTQKTSKLIYTAIFVSVAALLIIIFVAGIVFCIKCKRSKPCTREESGYYANFSRASLNQAKRKASCNKQENQELPELKATDDPVYLNIEAPPDQMDQSMDYTDNIYANVDYSKPPSLSVEVNDKVTAFCSVSHSCPTMPPSLSWSHSGIVTRRSKRLNTWKWETVSTLTFPPLDPPTSTSL